MRLPMKTTCWLPCENYVFFVPTMPAISIVQYYQKKHVKIRLKTDSGQKTPDSS